MPTYDYRCTDCRETFEVVRSVSEDSPVACPSCGGDCKRVFTPVGVVFKGSGFHNTDYRKRPAESAPKAESSCPAADGGSSKCAGCPSAAAE